MELSSMERIELKCLSKMINNAICFKITFLVQLMKNKDNNLKYCN